MNFVKKIYHEMRKKYFFLTGMRPWTRGYQEYKNDVLMALLRDSQFDCENLSEGYGFRLDERIVEYPWFISRMPANEKGKLLDAGSVLNFDYMLSHDSLKNKNIYISTLAPESACYWNQGVSYIYEDLRNTSFKDECFDWIASLSTIEHIGLDNTMLYTADVEKNESKEFSYLEAIREYKRILKTGGKLYLSFPFGRRANHGWFQIFDSEMLDATIETFSAKEVKEFHFKYDADGWRVSSREESKNATYFDIHMQKEYDKDFAAASRAIVCLELTK